MIFVASLLAAALALTACGSQSSSGETTADTTAAETTEEKQAQTEAEDTTKEETTKAEEATEASDDSPPSDCKRPSPKIVAAIEEGLTVGGGGSLGNAYAVRSDDFENVWMVAAEIKGEGMDGTIGVWATNDIREYGLIYAADSFAREFSDWGEAAEGVVDLTDDGIDEAKACLG